MSSWRADQAQTAPLRLATTLERGAVPLLPVPSTPLVGRERELATALALLAEPEVRLLTLVGPGGVGKTRLALAVAARAAAGFADGVAFVPLAPIADPGLVLPTVAQALGITDVAGRPLLARVLSALRSRDVLLVLDNFEQLLAAAALIADLLAACPTLKLLVTSRATLRLSGEHAYPVPPLALPDAAADAPGKHGAAGQAQDAAPAVRLFLARPRAVRPDFAPIPAEEPIVAAICRRLDGLPLAIELAAAWVTVLPPAALLARLERRLPLLTGGPRDAPARLRTMRDAIAWSHDLLAPEEQVLFRRLAVFVGGFTLDAAEAVGGSAALDLVASLLDASLLQRVAGSEEDPRFAMLETVREYALERLTAAGEADETRRRHAAWGLALAEAAARRLRAPEQGAWLERLDAEHDNLRAALTWSLAAPDGADTALRLSTALHWYWHLRGHNREGRRWLDAALRLAPATRTATRATALAGLIRLASRLNDFAAATAAFDESVAIARELGDRGGVAYALLWQAMAAPYEAGDYAAMAALADESLALYRAVGDTWGTATALWVRGVADLGANEAAAEARLEESLALYRSTGDAWGISWAANAVGDAARARGDLDRAAALLEESLTHSRALRYQPAIAVTLLNLGGVALGRGDLPRAASYLAEALAVRRAQGDEGTFVRCLIGIAGLAERRGQPDAAARLLGAAEGLIAATATVLEPVDQADLERDRVATRHRLGPDRFAALWEAGKALPLEPALAEAAAVADAAAAEPAPSVAPADPSPAAATALSPREVEVLRLVAEGRSDQEIAAALFVSRRTVGSHVGSILAKLGAPSRSAAAAYAVRRGIV